MKYSFTCIALLVAQLVFGQGKQVLPAEKVALGIISTQNIEAEMDAIFNQAYPANSPGATVLIAKNNEIIYRKAFGMANLELNVPMKPENVL